jgi:hypothetical protein
MWAADREGLLTVFDVEQYVKRKVADPDIVGPSGRVEVVVQHSHARSKDLLLSAMPARASPDPEKDNTSWGCIAFAGFGSSGDAAPRVLLS